MLSEGSGGSSKREKTQSAPPADFAILGMAFAVLRHRVVNTFGVMPPSVTRLRSRLSSADSEIIESLGVIEHSIESLSSILNALSILQEPKIVAPTDINLLLDDVCDELCKQAGRIQTHFDLASELPTAYTSAALSREVFRIVIENAIREVHPTLGWVTLRTRPNSSRDMI